jgi:hypothetical protein
MLEHQSKSQTWEQCRTTAQNLLRKRKKEQALAISNEAVAAAQAFGDSDFRYGVALCVQGDMLAANEKNSEAKAAYKKSIKVLNRAEKIASAELENRTKTKSGPLNKVEEVKIAEQKVQLRLIQEDIANSFDHLGKVYEGEGKASDAAKSFDKASEKYEQVVTADMLTTKSPELIVHQQFVRCLHKLAQAAAANGDSALADKAFKKAVAQAATSYCSESDRKEIRNNYLKYLQQAGRNQEATGLMADVLFDQLTADGTLSMFEGDLTAAEISYRKALEEAAKSVYSEQRILKALFNLTTVFVRAGKFDEVQRCNILANQFMLTHRNGNRKEYDQIQEVLANYYLVIGKPSPCKEALQQQLRYKIAKYGQYSREVCTVLAQLGQCEMLFDWKNLTTKPRANQYANDALAIIKSHPLDRSYYDAIQKLSSLMSWLDRYEDARDLDRTLIEMKARKYGPGDPWLVGLKINLVALEQKFNHREEAGKLIKEIVDGVSNATPEQKAGCFPYIVLLLAYCVHSKWWDNAESVAHLGESILHNDLANAFPSDTARQSWTRDIAILENQLKRKIS